MAGSKNNQEWSVRLGAGGGGGGTTHVAHSFSQRRPSLNGCSRPLPGWLLSPWSKEDDELEDESLKLKLLEELLLPYPPLEELPPPLE